MTKEDIIDKGSFSQKPNYSKFEINLFIPFFDKEVVVMALNLPTIKSEAEMKLVTDIINELLSFNSNNEIWLKQEIWNHYQACIQNISYNDVSTEGFSNEKDANKAHFQIFTKDQAYNNAHIKQIWFDVSFLDFRYFNLEYECPWETEHGIKIGVMNGKFDSIQ